VCKQNSVKAGNNEVGSERDVFVLSISLTTVRNFSNILIAAFRPVRLRPLLRDKPNLPIAVARLHNSEAHLP
jgi:hypothetical protein